MNNNQNIFKNFKLISLIATLLIVIGMLGAWLAGATGSGGTITLEEEVALENVLSISINARNQRVMMHPTDEDEVRVISSGVPSGSTLTAEVVNGVLNINSEQPTRNIQIGFIGLQELRNPPTLDIYLPTVAYERVQINTTNMRIEMSGFSIDDLHVETTNSRIEIHNISDNAQMDIRSTNGRITASSITSEDARFRTTNSRVEMTDFVGDELEVETTNGRIEMNNISGHVNARTTNSRIYFRNETIEQNVSLQSTNGRIEMDLSTRPENADFSISTTNGRTRIFGEERTHQTFGDGTFDETLRTTNSRITVE